MVPSSHGCMPWAWREAGVWVCSFSWFHCYSLPGRDQLKIYWFVVIYSFPTLVAFTAEDHCLRDLRLRQTQHEKSMYTPHSYSSSANWTFDLFRGREAGAPSWCGSMHWQAAEGDTHRRHAQELCIFEDEQGRTVNIFSFYWITRKTWKRMYVRKALNHNVLYITRWKFYYLGMMSCSPQKI